METTIVHWGHAGIMAEKVETSIDRWGMCEFCAFVAALGMGRGSGLGFSGSEPSLT